MEPSKKHYGSLPVPERSKRYLKQAGFSFIEAILSIALLSGGMLSLLNYCTDTLAANQAPNMQLHAMQLAQERLESTLYDKIRYGWSHLVSANYPDETLSNTDRGYTRRTEITDVNPNNLSAEQSGSGYRRVRVTVSWGDETEQVRLEQLVSNWSPLP